MLADGGGCCGGVREEEDAGSGGGSGGPVLVGGLGVLLLVLPVDIGNPMAGVTDCGSRGGGGGGGKEVDGVEGGKCVGALRSSMTRNRNPCHS